MILFGWMGKKPKRMLGKLTAIFVVGLKVIRTLKDILKDVCKRKSKMMKNGKG